MAFVRIVTGDLPSAEKDQLRRTVNTLLQMLETAEASLTAGASAEDILNAWADAVRTGRDNNPASIANVVSTGLEVVGVRGTAQHPPRPGSDGQLKAMTLDDGDR